MHKLAKFRLEQQTEFLHLQLLSICLEGYFNLFFLKYISDPISKYNFPFFASFLGLLLCAPYTNL